MNSLLILSLRSYTYILSSSQTNTIGKYNWPKYVVYEVLQMWMINKLLRHFIRIIRVNFDMSVSENLWFTVYGGLIVISVHLLSG